MSLKLHPLLNNPDAVLIYRDSAPEKPGYQDFQRVASKIFEIMRVELEGEKVTIKPNLTSATRFADPDNGITTHPGFIEGIVGYLATHGARRGGITIVEDPVNSDDHSPRCWEGTGYPEMAERTGANLRSPNSYFCAKKVVPNPLVHPVRNVTRYAVDPKSVLLNIPKMKTHNLGITSLCLKNLMGLDDVFERHYCGQAWRELPANRRRDDIPKNEWMDQPLHEVWQTGLARRLADLAQVIKPDLNIVEGVVARDGTGFNRGRNFPLGLAVAGVNMVAVDSVSSYLMGFSPQELIYLKIAHEAGLGNNDLSRLTIYVVENNEIKPCDQIKAIRAPEPFQVIRDIIGDL